MRERKDDKQQFQDQVLLSHLGLLQEQKRGDFNQTGIVSKRLRLQYYSTKDCMSKSYLQQEVKRYKQGTH